MFTEYYLQDCKANLDLLQEEAGEVEVSKSSISLCNRINREQELDGTAMPWWLLKVGPVVCCHCNNQTEILSILTITQKLNQQTPPSPPGVGGSHEEPLVRGHMGASSSGVGRGQTAPGQVDVEHL